MGSSSSLTGTLSAANADRLDIVMIMHEGLQNWRERLSNNVRLDCRPITVCM